MAKTFIKKKITPEVVSNFIEGHDPQERIVNFEYSYKDDFIKVFYRDENDDKHIDTQPFYPFLWAAKSACEKLTEKTGRAELSSLMKRYGIWCKELDVTNIEGEVVEEMLDGYRFMFYATSPMSYSKFLEFFRVAGNAVYSSDKRKDEKNSRKESFTDIPISKKDSRQYLVVTPIEQYMISTGKRMFKGYDDYDQCLRLIFDWETTGLDTKRDRIEKFGMSFNRPVKYKGKLMDFKQIFHVKGDTKEEKDASEMEGIINFLKIIYTFKPDIITAHNGEAFDWNILIGACERLGTTLEELSVPFFEGVGITKNPRETILKLGGEIETFHQTIVPGCIVTDSLHAVRRAQALDSNMLFSNLKYVTKYSKIVKPDRVYVPGDRISEIGADKKHLYAFCMTDGDWYLYDPKAPSTKKVEPNPEFTIEYFQKQINEEQSADYHKEYREFLASRYYENKIDELIEKGDDYEIDAFEETWDDSTITLSDLADYAKDYPYEQYLEDVIFSDKRDAQTLYNDYIASIEKQNVFKKGKEADKFTMYTRNYVEDGYTLVSGEYVIDRYLTDDLWECDRVEHRYNTSNFLVCKMLPVPFQKCCTMGTAGQWKALMLAWSYENNLAIPPFGESKTFTGGLSRLLRVGFVDNVAKFDYNSLYPSIILTWAISDRKDLMHSMLAFLEHVLTQREKYKKLKKAANKKAEAIKVKLQNHEYTTKEEGEVLRQEMLKWKAEEAFNDKKQLPLKIFGNSFFGSYGAPNVFPWASIDCAERTTCTGRMSLRLMIYWFNSLGYAPIVGDTDGFNFKLPHKSKFRYTDAHPYISTGLSRETEEGKAYTGFKADVAEFNDMFMCDMHYSDNAVNKMGLGIDEVVSATINFSRKNYADYFPENPFPEDIKMVGNTIKSKKMPEYIAKFLEKGIRLLEQKKGQEFLNEYYTYIDKIYNYQIPMKMIASKGKVKKSLEDYIKDCTTITKAGRPKSRQAWMELAIREGLDVNMGETIYYINTGKSKSQADVKKVTHYYTMSELTDIFSNGEREKKDVKVSLEKEWKTNNVDGKLAPKDKKLAFNEYVKKHHSEVKIEEEIILNCRLVPIEVIESESDIYCEDGEEYNVPKYIDQFNKRITPLLVCFHPDIRNKILITNPSDKPYFTKKECRLCSGFPNKEGDQDTYEQLMTMDDKEIRFWLKHPEWEIPFMKECGMNWEEIVKDYNERMEREKQLGIDKIREEFEDYIENLDSETFDKFEEGEIPSDLLSLIDIDPKTGNFVAKEYPDIVIGTICDVYDAYIAKSERMEAAYEEEP